MNKIVTLNSVKIFPAESLCGSEKGKLFEKRRMISCEWVLSKPKNQQCHLISWYAPFSLSQITAFMNKTIGIFYCLQTTHVGTISSCCFRFKSISNRGHSSVQLKMTNELNKLLLITNKIVPLSLKALTKFAKFKFNKGRMLG